ncbi:F-actin-monooxygenase mical1 isoform X1 [Xiphophorus hellerii]|uniref:F-actin-monooxygenase mical1 isoform X1 n=1 Tax=Xiphophorus hellerii TaxID=8084 RepID=UPI0013B42405|nr:F-actin-monooxygenase mical1-like isoform X1 [Xiphophorus hellerii]XP_032414724.1 F-actin-monooxygenase mical1-like isoform X1 [Xiphophorus hellerii]
MANKEPVNPSHATFDLFVQAKTCQEVKKHFTELCRQLQLDPKDYSNFYTKLKESLNYWKAKAVWTKLDKRASQEVYEQGKACAQNKCLVLGAGPCGLRTAIELSLLGAQVVVLEKREEFTRNNVLHLWPFTIYDIRELGAKKFYGKFCSGSLDHISIRQLQLILLKVCLILGVEVHTGVEYKGLIEPSVEKGWMAKLQPPSHPAAAFEFDVFISAGGGRFVPEGFKHKELRGQLAIGITANFVNRNTAAEIQVPEISGVARIYNQKFFQDLLNETDIDLENIVYYKDDTHYFVMTAKRKSLLKRGVIKQDYSDADQLLAPANVDHVALYLYAHEAAYFSTGGQLPDLQFALNPAGQPDVAMFDFTCMHRAEHASLVRERRGKKLLIALVGDCLVEPFWPLGTGIARGFLASFDTAWTVRSWGMGVQHMTVIAERESMYQLLSQTTTENTSKKYPLYSIDPKTRYQRINLSAIHTRQVQQLYDEKSHSLKLKENRAHKRQDTMSGFNELLRWCQNNTRGYDNVNIKDFSQSWKSGLALCALIHHFKPHLIDISSLDEANRVHNNQLAFSVINKELGIPPVMSPSSQIDKLSMVVYLTQIKDAVTLPPKEPAGPLPPTTSQSLSRTQSAVFFLSKLKHLSLQKQKERQATLKRGAQAEKTMEDEKTTSGLPASPEVNTVPAAAAAAASPPPEPEPAEILTTDNEQCYFCGKMVYAVERISAEGRFFHRSCFTCHSCDITLRLGGYAFDKNSGRFYCEMHSEDLLLTDGVEASCEDINEDEENGLSSESYTLSPSCSLKQESVSSTHSDDQEEPDQIIHHSKGDSQEPQNPSTFPDPAAKPEILEPTQDEAVPSPVPKPRLSRQTTPTCEPSPPVAKPRKVVLTPQSPFLEAAPEETSKVGPDVSLKPLRKLQLSVEERNELGNLQSFSADSDSETQGGSSSCSSSSANAGGPPKQEGQDGQEEEGYWSGSTASLIREKKNRHCFKRKEMPSGQNRVRSKFSPWNLSSPRISRDCRLTVHPGRVETTFQHVHSTSEDGVDDDDDDDDDDDYMFDEQEDLLDMKLEPSDPVQAKKFELKRMKTLQRRAKMSVMDRFCKAQSIQRRLEEIEVSYKDLEEKGVKLERSLRRQPNDNGSSETIEEWIQLVHEKNALVSEESDLMVESRQLELEDKRSTLELEYRKLMEIEEKTPEQEEEENQIFQQILEVVEMMDSLVTFLDEKRQKEMSENEEALSIKEAKRHSKAGAQVQWA